MFIRQTRTNNKATGEAYFTFRLVRGERIAGKVRQVTVLNLGRHFPILQDDWPLLCSRLEQLLNPQSLLCRLECPDKIERTAQRLYQQLMVRSPVSTAATDHPHGNSDSLPSETGTGTGTGTAPPPTPDLQTVDIGTLQAVQVRSVGVEHVALHAIAQLGLVQKLTELGINAVGRACIVGNLIGRMAQPASELATWDWLQTHSALGELLDVDFTALSHMRLYRASDALLHQRQAVEAHIFGTVTQLFALEETVTLYDLTNTYMEGQAQSNAKASHGRSKEKRTDCPLVTLGLVLDGSGFVRRSQTFEGKVSEGPTLQVMLQGLQAAPGALVIMDAGIATQANVDWLLAHQYRYLVVRRGGTRQFDATEAVSTETANGQTVRLQAVPSADGKELELYCHSSGREAKETAMVKRFCQRFEAGLQKIADGLGKPRGQKKPEKLQQRIGRLKEKSQGVSQHYRITLDTDESGQVASALTWKQELVQGSMATHPGVYCLRTNVLDWDAPRLWQMYSTLTDIESVFRSLKGELGLRPVFHQTEFRADGHLFITVLAYQCVQVIRKTLKAHGIHGSWASLRQTLSQQVRVTVTMQRSDGRSIHIRQASKAEPAVKQIYRALGISAAPGGSKKLVV